MYRDEEVTEEMLSDNDSALISVFGYTPDMPDALEVWRTHIMRSIDTTAETVSTGWISRFASSTSISRLCRMSYQWRR